MLWYTIDDNLAQCESQKVRPWLAYIRANRLTSWFPKKGWSGAFEVGCLKMGGPHMVFQIVGMSPKKSSQIANFHVLAVLI